MVMVAVTATAGVQAAQARVAPSITLKPTSGPPTAKVSVTGVGFGSTEGVVVKFGTIQVATATTSAVGGFSTTFKVPKSEQPGTYPVTATGQVSGLKATKNFLVRTNSPQFRFNAALSGANPYENTINTTNVSSLTHAWTDNLSNSVNSSPAVAGGVVYAAASGGFYAFNATNGLRLWSDPGASFNQSSPAVSGGVAYAAGVDGKFYAFKASGCGGATTCQPQWTATIDGAGSVAQSSPTVAGGFVYVSAGYNFYAFKAAGCGAATCKPAWTAAISPSNGESPVSGQSSPAVVGGVVYVGGYQGLYAYDAAGINKCSGTPKTCQPLWFGNTVRPGVTDTVNASSPAVVGGVAYIGAGRALYAFSTSCSSTCGPLWSFVTGNEIDSSPAVASGKIYIGSEDGHMYVLNTSGVLQWSAATATGSNGSSPTVANGVVYIGAYQNLDAFTAAGCGTPTCSPTWTAPLTGAFFSTPVVANGMVYQGEITNGKYMEAYKLP
jgi:serine/threonine-protein kinase